MCEDLQPDIFQVQSSLRVEQQLSAPNGSQVNDNHFCYCN